MIKCTMIGHIGKDATVNNVNGKTVINFSVAHTEKWNDAQGQQQSKVIWADCSQWTDKTAVASYLLKGTQVFVEGIPEVRTYQTADGKSGASLSLKVLSIQLLGSPQQQQAPAPQQGGYQPQYAPQPQQQAAPQGYQQPAGQPSYPPQPQYQPQQQYPQQPQQQQPVYDPNNQKLPF
jgi:single-strand DNA-binding protein